MTSSNSIPTVDSVWSGGTIGATPNGGYYITNAGTTGVASASSYFTKTGELCSTIGTDKYTVDLNEVYEHIQLLKHFMKEQQSPVPVPNWEAMEKYEILRKQWEDVVEACNTYRITEALLTGQSK
jgi:hypothetical protein